MATILVVDDYTTSQRLLRFILQQDNHNVIIAHNGLQALDCLAHGPVDLILTDLMMPEMDGLSFLEHLQAEERYRTLPVIALTGSSREQDYQRARAAGVTVLLTKPFDSQEILETVSRLVQPTRERAVGAAGWSISLATAL
jgi:two-component system, chemotaxis family, chemotaxis protein CheY